MRACRATGGPVRSARKLAWADGRGEAMFSAHPATVKPTRPEAMEPSAPTLEADDRANELYWGSDRSVNQIAEDLELSKGALYGMIRPLPAGLACPACGTEVVHPNRTAKDKGLVDCPACGWDGSEDETLPWRGEPSSASERARAAGAPRVLRVGSPADSGVVVGGALLGAAVGLALILWARRR
jgi:hypothetical protein